MLSGRCQADAELLEKEKKKLARDVTREYNAVFEQPIQIKSPY